MRLEKQQQLLHDLDAQRAEHRAQKAAQRAQQEAEHNRQEEAARAFKESQAKTRAMAMAATDRLKVGYTVVSMPLQLSICMRQTAAVRDL